MSLFDSISNTLSNVASNPLAAGLSYATGNPAYLLSYAGGAPTSNQMSGLLQTAGGQLQSQASSEAAKAAAQRALDAANYSKTASSFRPFGVTSSFGASNFQYDPTTGQLSGAGYTPSAFTSAAQNMLQGSALSNLANAGNASNFYAPLQAGSQNLFGLANQYLGQSPQEVAQNYYTQQQNLLAPTRERQLGLLNQNMYNTGTTGLKVGSTTQGFTGAGSTGLQGTNPLAEALANAWSQQDAQLAAAAPQYAQQQIGFGAGLLGSGASNLGNYYSGLAGAYSPFTANLGALGTLEEAAQQPLTLGSNLANLASTAGARSGALYQSGVGNQNALLTGNAATTSPLASFLSGAGSAGSPIASLMSGLWGSGTSGTGLGNISNTDWTNALNSTNMSEWM